MPVNLVIRGQTCTFAWRKLKNRPLIRQTFKKGERLRSKKLIGFLFGDGRGFFQYPFKTVYFLWPEKREFPVEVLITVSKKKIKSAVKRNKIKRLVREAYRKNKHILWDSLKDKDQTLLVAFIYVANEVLEFKEIEKKIILILQRLKKENEEADR